MNPAILARLFQAQTDSLNQAQHAQSLDVQQEPGALWPGNSNGPVPSTPAPMGLDNPQGDPGAMQGRMDSIDNSTLPPSDYKYLDRVEGDGGQPLGVMFGQQAGQPTGPAQNVPMGQLPHGAQEGQYISPLDIQPQRMRTIP